MSARSINSFIDTAWSGDMIELLTPDMNVVLDIRHKPNGSIIAIDDLQEALERIDYKIKAGDYTEIKKCILLLNMVTIATS